MVDVTAGPVRVLVVDDEALVRTGLRLVLEGAAGIEVVGEAGDGSEVPGAIEAHDPTLVLMDIRMPEMDGIEATRRIRAERQNLPVVVLTTFGADASVLAALEAGASGFLLKDTPPEELVGAVRSAATGRIILSPAVTKRVVAAAIQQPESRRDEAARERLAVLTPREREVAEAVGDGLTNDEIGQRLFLAPTTVKTHVGRVMMKLDLQNRVQVAICVHEART